MEGNLILLYLEENGNGINNREPKMGKIANRKTF